MNNKIKVLQVIPKLGYGGAETGCYDLAHFLPERNCKSYIVTSGGELLKFVKKEKVKVFRLPVQSKNPILIFNLPLNLHLNLLISSPASSSNLNKVVTFITDFLGEEFPR